MKSKFGFRDVVGIVISLIVFGLGMKYIPDLTWLTKSIWLLFIIKLVGSFILAVLTYTGLSKILIPTDSEIASATLKKDIADGINEVYSYGKDIQELSRKVRSSYRSQTYGLGLTISNIATKLKPDTTNPKENDLFSDSKGSLVELAKLKGKLNLFLENLEIVVDLENGVKRTTAEKQMVIFNTFYLQTLPDMVKAMETLEINLDSQDISPALALSQTLEDLLKMDGLLSPKSSLKEEDLK